MSMRVSACLIIAPHRLQSTFPLFMYARHSADRPASGIECPCTQKRSLESVQQLTLSAGFRPAMAAQIMFMLLLSTCA